MSTPLPARLPNDQWLDIVAHTPLISIDLIVQDAEHRVLLGYRNNEPARNTLFVPGGVVRKNERLDDAFARITQTELGMPLSRRDASLLGVFEHLYASNFAASPGVSTHYIVLAHAIRVARLPLRPADTQHREFVALTPEALRAHPQVHPNTKAYFPENPVITASKQSAPPDRHAR